jgi:hypothetical protein
VKKPDGVRAIPYSKVKRETVEWFWEEMIPYGMLTLLVGDPGLGKSLFTVYLAATASREGVSSILLSAEDHKGATIRPRLEAAGADLKLVHHVEVRRDGVEGGLWLPDDGAKLDKLIEDTNARLVVVDPLSAHLTEGTNSWNDQSIRRALTPLHRAAEKRGCTVLVVAHLNKATGQQMNYRTGGSIGILAAVRSALLLAPDPGDPERERGSQRILAHFKSNVGNKALSRACEVRTTLLPGKHSAEAAYLEITGFSMLSGQDLLNAEREVSNQRQSAAEFVLEQLAEGPLPSTALKAAAKEAGHSWRTVERAMKDLKVKKRRVGGKGRSGKQGGGGGHWLRELP